jgi:hypothetical protein|tara:strand:- start:1117 stop:1614 length:498 start_codon:yes stop_codon:yes gene_type:complete
MTKKLEELLELPEVKDTMAEVEEPKEVDVQKVEKQAKPMERSIAEFDKISAALPMVKGLGELADRELDELADKAKSTYDDLMDLGMNVDSRYAGRVFEVAVSSLRHAIDAKSQKLDKKLKMVELQLKKQQIDQKQGDNSPTVDSEGVVIDRNALIDRILNSKEDK